MAARACSERMLWMYGGKDRVVDRTNAANVSQGIGSGASRFPPLVMIEPCPIVPWHCQQPFSMYAVLPRSADAATEGSSAIRAIAPANTNAKQNRMTVRFIAVASRHRPAQARLP